MTRCPAVFPWLMVLAVALTGCWRSFGTQEDESTCYTERDCDDGYRCSEEGSCVCDPDSCSGCCSRNGNTCYRGIGVRNCGSDGEDCANCENEGMECLERECVYTGCDNACDEGDLRRCSHAEIGFIVEECQFDPDTLCLSWQVIDECDESMGCHAGECLRDCPDSCALMTVTCLDWAPDSVFVCTISYGDECPTWSILNGCEQGESCRGGACRSDDCVDECEYNLPYCDQGELVECKDVDDDDCLELVKRPCAGEESCVEGFCCRNECELTETQCDERGWVSDCGYFDSDPCLDWSTYHECPRDMSCSGRLCSLSCADSCSPGPTSECTDVYNRVACETASGSCPSLNEVACGWNEVCVEGVCEFCDTDCPVGETYCEGPHQMGVCTVAEDGCLTWSTEIWCGEYGECEDGICRNNCSVTCDVSDGTSGLNCLEDDFYQLCTPNEETDCDELSPPIECPSGWTCDESMGGCVPPYSSL